MTRRVEERVLKLEVRDATTKTVLEGIRVMLVRMDERMEGMDHVIRGNGRPGLVSDVRELSQRIMTMEGSRSRYRDAFFSVAGAVIAGLILFSIQTVWRNHHEPNLPQVQQKP